MGRNGRILLAWGLSTLFLSLLSASSPSVHVNIRGVSGAQNANVSPPAATAYVSSSSPTIGVGGAGANVWVDADGGTCSRSASQVAYTTAIACPTLNAAYLVAQPGDVVGLASGQTITVGTISVDAAKAGNTTDVVFQAGFATLVDACPSGSCGTVFPFTINAHDITFRDFKFANQTSNLRDDYEQPATGAGSNNITFVNLDSSSIQIFGQNTVVTGGDIGPCFANKANPVCTPRAFGSTNAVFDGVTFHDQMADLTPGGPCASPSNPTDTCHTDGLAIFAGATNTTVKNSIFYNDLITNIRVQNTGGTNSGVTLQNNFFGVPWQASALPSTDDTTTTTVTNPWLFGVDLDTPTAGLVIEHNSFYFRPSCPTGTGCGNGLTIGSTAGTSASPAIIRGNIMTVQGGVCGFANASWTYNIIRAFSDVNGPTAPTGNCNSTNVFQPYNTTWPYVTAPPFSNAGTGLIDFHITGPAWIGDELDTSGSCPPFDIGGRVRSNPCDAGAAERSLNPGASLATCSPSACTQGTLVSHTVTAPDSTAGGPGGPSSPLNVTRTYYTSRPNNLVGNAPLMIVAEATSTDSAFLPLSATNRYVFMELPNWQALGVTQLPTVARLSPAPVPHDCGAGANNTCDDIPAIKAAIDAVIAAGGIDTSRIYMTGTSKTAIETMDVVCDTRTYTYLSGAVMSSWYMMVQNANTVPVATTSQTAAPPFCPSMLGTDRTAGDGIGGAALSPPHKNTSLLYMWGTADTLACTASNNAPSDCLEVGWVDNQNRWVYSYPQIAGEASPPSSNGATGRSGGGSSVMPGAVMGCNGTPSSTTVDTAAGGNVTTKIYTGCTQSQRATGTIRVNGGGHAWPGLDQVDGFSSEQATWNFLAAYGGP